MANVSDRPRLRITSRAPVSFPQPPFLPTLTVPYREIWYFCAMETVKDLHGVRNVGLQHSARLSFSGIDASGAYKIVEEAGNFWPFL